MIAKSFARIHRRNLVALGILPLVFADESDYERAEQGQSWRIERARSTVEDGSVELRAEVEGGEPVELLAELSDGERKALLAGGLLKLVREGGLAPAAR